MSASLVLVLIPGLIPRQCAALIDAGGRAHGVIAGEPLLSQAAARAVLLKGVVREGERALAPDLIAIVRDTGGTAATLHADSGADVAARAATLIEEGAALLVIDWADAGDCSWVRLFDALGEINLLVVGYGTGAECSAFIAGGPDIVPGARIDATLVDLHPSALSLLQIVPPPGPISEGRALHELLRSAQLSDQEHQEVLEHLRAVGYLE